MLPRAQAAEPRKWPVELTVGQFKIHSDFELGSHRRLATELTRMSQDVSTLLGVSTTDAPIHVVLFQSAGEYGRYMQAYFPALPQRRAIFIQDRGPGMLFTHWHEDVATDLRHEVVHALLNDGSGTLPLWLDEGLAEYFEVDARLRYSGNPYADEVTERARGGFIPSLAQLERVNDLQHFHDEHYRDSWAWVHFLIHRRSETRQLLTRYLNDARSGAPILDMSRQLPELVPDLEAEYQEHFRILVSEKHNLANSTLKRAP